LAVAAFLVVKIWVPMFFFGETLWIVFLAGMFHIMTILHITFLINSLAHSPSIGKQLYDQSITAVDSNYGGIFFGEGHHNYHHTFPWDYRSSEQGAWDNFNPGTAVINFFHAIGWATDLKMASPEMVANRRKKMGDHSPRYQGGLKNQLIGFSRSPFIWPFLPMLILKWCFNL